MHITQLSAQNLMGMNATFPAEPLTFISGKNRSGKSSIIAAIQLALAGRIPGLGAREVFTAAASGNPLLAEVLFGPDIGISRTLRQGAKGEVSAEVNVIGDLSPEDVADIPLLNAGAYFAMTDSERIAYVLRYCELPADLSIPGIVARLQRVTFGETHSEEIEKAKADMIDRARRELEIAGSPAAGVIALVKDGGLLKTEYTVHNRAQKDTAGAVRTMMMLKNREGECSADAVEELERDIKRLTEDRTAIAGELATLRDRAASIDRTEARRAALALTIKTTQVPPKAAFDAIAAKIEAAEAEFDKLPDLPSKETDNILTTDANADNRAAAVAEADRVGRLAAVELIKADIAALDALKECPHCGGKAKGWDKRIRERLNASLKDAIASVSAAEQAAKEAQQKADASFTMAAARSKARAERTAAEAALESLRRELGSLATAKQIAEAAINRAKDELDAMPAPPAPLDAALLADYAAKIASLDSQIAGLNNRRDTALQLRQDIKRAAQAEIAHLGEKAYVTVIDAIGGELREVQREMIAKAFGKLIDDANKITGAAMPPLAFKDGIVGYYNRDGRFVTYKTFSGLERTLGFIGIAAALSVSSIYRGLCLDEFHTLTPTNQAIAIKSLENAVGEGLIDQAFIVMPTDEDAPVARGCPKGWKHIAL